MQQSIIMGSFYTKTRTISIISSTISALLYCLVNLRIALQRIYKAQDIVN